MLYHFQLELSNIDQNLYCTLDFRLAQHPSETASYLLTRTLAYVLSYRENLEFSPAGLGDPEAPALWAKGVHGAIELWIEIGNPSPRKVHRASKAAQQVIIYTYKNPQVLIESLRAEEVHRVATIQVYAFDAKMLAVLEKQLKKNNRWQILHQQGQLDIDTGNGSVSAEIQRFN